MCPRWGQEIECGIAELLARVHWWYLQKAAVPRAGRLPVPFCPERAMERVLGTSKSDLYPWGCSGAGRGAGAAGRAAGARGWWH